ncbi:MAG: putative lipid II flippase FtsW [Clostridia bacterium]|nr:putative lipid II flippase FtsW [Clostridia bacterium]
MAERFAVKPAEQGAEKTITPPKREKRTLLSRRRLPVVQRIRSGIDWPFALLVLILLSIGTVFVFSSSYVYAFYRFNDSYYFISKQIGWVAASIIIFFVVSRFMDYLWLRKFAVPLFVVSYLLLWAAFAFGADYNGARRWIYFGPISVQPSEIVKFTVIVLISAYIVWLDARPEKDLIRRFRFGILPFAGIVLLVGVPLFLQPHLSAMIIIFALIFLLMYLGGVKQNILFTLLGTGGAAMLAVILFTTHGKSRINNWLHPENDLQGKGWQPLQSSYAIGSGGLWGVGLGQSKQKHMYLPEPQNDYIFAILCEEMGFVFAVAVIVLFILLIWRGFRIARNAPSKFASLLVMGIMIQIGLQVFLNIGVVSGALPSTGVSLPFFSYGGSSLLIFMAEMGVVLNVSKYSYMEKS